MDSCGKGVGQAVRPVLALGLLCVILSLLFSCQGEPSGVASFRNPGASRGIRSYTIQEIVKDADSLLPACHLCTKTYELLKEEFIRLVRSQFVGKLVATPPIGTRNKVSDLSITGIGDGLFSVAWSYVNIGDYNQDGIVDVADVSPLAEHFGERKNGGVFPHPQDFVIDGNKDGVIDVGDIAPIAENIFSEVMGYIIEGSDDSQGEFSEIRRVAFADAIKGNIVTFAVQVENPPKYLRVVPFDSAGSRGEASEPAETPLPPPPELYPPVAIFSVSPPGDRRLFRLF